MYSRGVFAFGVVEAAKGGLLAAGGDVGRSDDDGCAVSSLAAHIPLGRTEAPVALPSPLVFFFLFDFFLSPFSILLLLSGAGLQPSHPVHREPLAPGVDHSTVTADRRGSAWQWGFLAIFSGGEPLLPALISGRPPAAHEYHVCNSM
ncbi:hypothetical protein VTN00DRAFT_673 [Thermoascus crustaceus]|uniref:uncharacterized protein n=1 Tax=Thermoascus crustaceus TaxID=5088 RepID=UPI0037429A21